MEISSTFVTNCLFMKKTLFYSNLHIFKKNGDIFSKIRVMDISSTFVANRLFTKKTFSIQNYPFLSEHARVYQTSCISYPRVRANSHPVIPESLSTNWIVSSRCECNNALYPLPKFPYNYSSRNWSLVLEINKIKYI